MDNLDRLYGHLIDAQDYIDRVMLSSAKMSLMACEGLLIDCIDEYADVNKMFKEIRAIKQNLKRWTIYKSERDALVDKLEDMLDECVAWMDCRRVA